MLRLFKEQRKDFYNIDHPEFKGKIEEAFKSGKVRFYRFKSDTAMPYGRYEILQSFLLEHDLKMSHTLFKAFIKEIEENLDGSRGTVNLAKAFENIQKMKARAELAFSPDQAYNLASVVYFDETENLYEYDSEHNKRKIARWKEANDLTFFYTKPLDELLGLKAFSEDDLRSYIRSANEILERLTLDTHFQ